jgi:serine-type D-Ala-D-Ala carboxypeptidase (penicillin-binding protein 5/6)
MKGNRWIKFFMMGLMIELIVFFFPIAMISAKTHTEEQKTKTVKSAAAPQKAGIKKDAAKAAPAKKVESFGISKDPYIGAIVVDTRDGKVLTEDNADATCYPASVVKLMNLLVLEDHIANGSLKLDDPVTATVEATKMGGTQVWLKEKEVFPVEELIYAMMVESANDAATALAIHVAGSTEGYIQLMNQKAKELGMKSTRFASVHGLPPSNDRDHDVTTARDLATLGMALLKYPDILKYTSVKERPFRDGTFTLRSHNHLLGSVPGVDGLKTGYFREGGYCIVVTGEKKDVRLVSVVVGSKTRSSRDQQASALLSKGFLAAAPAEPQVTVTQAVANKNQPQPATEDAKPTEASTGSSFKWGTLAMTAAGILIGALVGIIFTNRKNSYRR